MTELELAIELLRQLLRKPLWEFSEQEAMQLSSLHQDMRPIVDEGYDYSHHRFRFDDPGALFRDPLSGNLITRDEHIELSFASAIQAAELSGGPMTIHQDGRVEHHPKGTTMSDLIDQITTGSSISGNPSGNSSDQIDSLTNAGRIQTSDA